MALRRPFALFETVVPRVEALKVAWHVRPERLWLGLIAVPLAEIATSLLALWQIWPILVLCAWTCTPSWKWLWLLSLEMGVIGVMWAAIGVTALAHLQNDRLLVGVIWAAFPLSLATAGTMNRRRAERPEAHFPLR